jgi:hypothetical protein
MSGVTGGSRGRLLRVGPCVGTLLVLASGSASAADPDTADTSQGYPDNPVSDYIDRSSDGLTPVDPPGTSAPSLTSVQVETPTAAPVKAPKPAEWMLVPIPGYNPTIGFSLTGMGAYIFPADAKSPPSTVGGFGMFSTNGSWAVGGISKLNLAEDHYRVTAFLMTGSRSSPGWERRRSSGSARSSPTWPASTSRTSCPRAASALE